MIEYNILLLSCIIAVSLGRHPPVLGILYSIAYINNNKYKGTLSSLLLKMMSNFIPH